MICDRMERLGCYRGLCKNLDKIIDRLTEGDAWKTMPEGRTEVDGDRAFINHSQIKLEKDRPLYEMHREYGDIHIAITGGETLGYLPVEAIAWPESAEETLVAPAQGGTGVQIEPGMFAIVFPWDAHKPSVGEGNCEKLVCKFRWKDEER